MKKSYLIMAAIASVALVSCSNEEYLGDPGGLTGERAISFDMSTPAMTRDEKTGEAAAEQLGYSFKVYGVKKVGDNYSNVFATNTYAQTMADANADSKLDGAEPYWAWYVENTAGKTNSNLNNWEYVGGAGTHGKTGHQITIDEGKDQTIKYWDRSAASYSFMAFKAKAVTSGTATISNVTPSGFTVTGTPDQLANLYVADKEVFEKGNTSGNVYGNPVRFTFRNFVSKIRFGIYENIPGYQVKIDKVYYANTDGGSNSKFGVNGSFSGNANESYGFTVTYDADGRAKGAHSSGTAQNYFETATNSPILSQTAFIGTTATGATYDQAERAYSIIMPDPNNTTGMTLEVDVTLTSEGGSGETIKLTKASATVPADYCKWKSNFAYTYLFKISDLTQFNGELLCPITLDAVVVDDGQGEQNTITVVETPSITTYQNGAIANDYSAANGIIFATVEDANGALLPLIDGTTQKAALYTFTGNYTEAEIEKALTVRSDLPSGADANAIQGRNGILLTPAKDGDNPLLNITNKIGEKTIGDNLVGQFTPAAGNYAFVYTQTAPTGTTPKYEAKSFEANASVKDYYCTYEYIAQTGDAIVGTTYYDNTTFVQTNLFCGQDATGLYVLNGTEYKPFTGKVTSGTYMQFNAVVSPSGNPSTQSWYEKVGDNYKLTTDTSVADGKAYYSATTFAAERLIAYDSFSTATDLYKKTGETTYVQVSSDDLTNGPIATTEYYSDAVGTTRVYILPQPTDGYSILQDYTTANIYRQCGANEFAIAGKKYYDKYDQNDGKFAVKVIKVQ